MFVFSKTLVPTQAINFKPSSKAPFGWMNFLALGASEVGATVNNINAVDPTSATADTIEDGTLQQAASAVALLTKVTWNLGATDPIEIEGLITLENKQKLVALLYVGLVDISCKFGVRVFEYDPVAATKTYYACFDTGAAALVGKLQKDGDKELAIELSDDEDLTVQDNSFFPFSIKVVPAAANQSIILAAKAGAPITKVWGKTSPATGGTGG